MSNMDRQQKYSSPDEIPLFLDANDIVRILGISKTNVYYMFRADGFPTITIGKRKFVRKEKLFSWLESQETPVQNHGLYRYK